MNQPTEERASDGGTQWACVVCGLILKEDAGEQVLGRIPIQRMSPAELAAKKAAEAEAEQRAAAEKAARAAALAKAVAQKRQEPAAGPAWQSGEGLEFSDSDDGEMVLEINGGETVVPAATPRAPAGDPLLEEVPVVAATAVEAVPQALFVRVLMAEDTALLREIVKDALVQNGISQQVRGCANGEEFLQAVAEALVARQPLDLAILDVEMPILSGYHAAIALRALERGLRIRATPIVFFTAFPCDDTFKKVLEHCQPARYLNKGADSSPPRIAGRLVQVLSSLKH